MHKITKNYSIIIGGFVVLILTFFSNAQAKKLDPYRLQSTTAIVAKADLVGREIYDFITTDGKKFGLWAGDKNGKLSLDILMKSIKTQQKICINWRFNDAEGSSNNDIASVKAGACKIVL